MYNFSVVPPVAPENLTIIRIDGTTLNVSWTPLTLAEAQGIILSYQLIYIHYHDYGNQINAAANTSYIVIEDLSDWQQYKVSIAAVTTAGVGKFSDFVYEDGECQYILSITDIIPCRKPMANKQQHKQHNLQQRDCWQCWRIVSFDYTIFN